MVEQRVSYRYAKAIIDSVLKSNNEEMILNDLLYVKNTMKSSSELTAILKSPVVHNQKKAEIISEIFKGKISDNALEFLMLLNKKGREGILLYVIIEFQNLYNKIKGILPITVSSAVDLDDVLKATITEKVAISTGKKIEARFEKDEKLLGGIKIRIDDWVYDWTIENQLKLIHSRLASGQAA